MDEPSLGLAPLIVAEVFDIIRELNEDGVTILLVEQNAHMALTVAHHFFLLRPGPGGLRRRPRRHGRGRGHTAGLSRICRRLRRDGRFPPELSGRNRHRIRLRPARARLHADLRSPAAPESLLWPVDHGRRVRRHRALHGIQRGACRNRDRDRDRRRRRRGLYRAALLLGHPARTWRWPPWSPASSSGCRSRKA